jgi:predicted RNase H-like nuclease
MHVVGVDSCPGGWIAMTYDAGMGTLIPAFFSTFAELVAASAAAERIGIDIPIGLAEGTPRQCDIEARKVLLWRRSSVFPAPDPRIVHCAHYADALARSYELCGKGISRQAFGIHPKVAEVNDHLTASGQDRVIEVHPEVSFWAMNDGQPMTHSKKRSLGFAERRDLLQRTLRIALPDRREIRTWARPAQPDDALDAIAAAWTANRAYRGEAKTLPIDPPFSVSGLRMEIVF